MQGQLTLPGRWFFFSGLLFLLVTSQVLLAHPGVTEKIRHLNQNIASAPNNQYLYIQRGLAYSNNSQPMLAMQDIEYAESLAKPIDAAFAHGILLYRAAQYEEAKFYFDRYLEAYPENTAALEYRARVLRDFGDYDAAIPEFLHLFHVLPQSNPGYYISTAKMMVALPTRYGTDAALTLLDEHMARLGVSSQVQRYAISLEIERENYAAAIERLGTLDQALRATPQWKYDVAQLYVLAGQPEQARPLLVLANEQLKVLRRTSSRLVLRKKISELMHTIDNALPVAPE